MRSVTIVAAICVVVALAGCRREVEYQPLKLGAQPTATQAVPQK